VLHSNTGGDAGQAFQELTSLFNETHPDANVEFRAIGGESNTNLDSVVARRLANDNAPDSAQGWPGKHLLKYEGKLGDITNVWEEEGFVDSMNPTITEAAKHDGAFRALPTNSHRLNNLFYNMDLFDEAGVDPESINSHSELISAFDKISQNTDAVPMASGNKAPWTTLQLWVEVFLGEEGNDAYQAFLNGDGDKAKMSRTFERLEEIYTNYINEDASTIGFVQANQKVMNGEAATIHQGSWAAGMYKNSDSFNYGEDWDRIEYPGTEDMYVFHTDGWIFFEGSEVPELQETWASFLGSKEVQVQWNNGIGSAPIRTDIELSKLDEFNRVNAKDLKEKPVQPLSLAHGLALEPEKMGNCMAAIGNEFLGSYNPEAAAEALIDAVA
jgi:glucose/mannose transport system substrate-binding protein